jgi:hypothetical protein
MDRLWDARNTESLALYERLLAGITDAQLEHIHEDGWSNGAVLCHLAFFDRRASALIKRWQHESPAPSEMDVHAINDANLPLQRKVPAAIARAEFFDAAHEVHELVAGLSDEQIQAIQDGQLISINRATHRNTHLRDLERSS